MDKYTSHRTSEVLLYRSSKPVIPSLRVQQTVTQCKLEKEENTNQSGARSLKKMSVVTFRWCGPWHSNHSKKACWFKLGRKWSESPYVSVLEWLWSRHAVSMHVFQLLLICGQREREREQGKEKREGVSMSLSSPCSGALSQLKLLS